jgi:hypothetical protein
MRGHSKQFLRKAIRIGDVQNPHSKQMGDGWGDLQAQDFSCNTQIFSSSHFKSTDVLAPHLSTLLRSEFSELSRLVLLKA